MRLLVLSLRVAFGLSACGDETGPNPSPDPDDATTVLGDEDLTIELSRSGNRHARTALSGGDLTVFDASPDAFSFPAPNLSASQLARFDDGDEAFEAEFGAAPGSPNPGLGPVFDNVSCEACHVGDGRGRPPVAGEPFESIHW